MSTKIFAAANTSIALPNVCYGKHPVVKGEQETLADYVRRVIRDKDLSYRKVADASGGKISPTTISDVINGQIGDIKTQTLKALAKGLGVPEDEIFAVARGKSLDASEAIDAEMALFASRVKKLTPQQKRDFHVAWRMANELLDRLEREQESK
jgi:transcriptional regulator with XRE-family HTH domain